ncbi:O6-methylguanine-DNA--protein-cysteine methyltransferase [Pseudorhizobium tarimense]|uniref:O6-methylguanine-DNA--protein-cysteine methyltransferase n=1 Tax=Pseudorhizobium tarimense TaxID=1079109 RepID=A0ABV2H1G7_9HYPH
MAMHRYYVFGTTAGFCAIAWSNGGISRFQLPTKSAEATERLMSRRLPQAAPGGQTPELSSVIEAVRRYFGGFQIEFSDLALDTADQDAFFRGIYAPLCRVGWGKTTTYGDLAKQLGPARKRRGGSAKPWPTIRYR